MAPGSLRDDPASGNPRGPAGPEHVPSPAANACGAPVLSTTTGYHRFVPVDLMSEFTICESFAEPGSPYGIVLRSPASYGDMVGEFLKDRGLLGGSSMICEVGGGYGSLMHGLLTSHGESIDRVCMVDLSSGLLQRQRDRLKAWESRVAFIQGDIHDLMGSLTGFDLLIANEIMGDLHTLTGVDPANPPAEADELIRAYGLDVPDRPFNLNLGALRLVEVICRSGIPAFLTEHSCDPRIPADMAYLSAGLDLDSFPREIRLHRHSEYTIRFSHLERVARTLGRTVETGALLEIIPVRKTHALETIFRLRASDTEAHEIVYELLDHVREYRWLVVR